MSDSRLHEAALVNQYTWNQAEINDAFMIYDMTEIIHLNYSALQKARGVFWWWNFLIGMGESFKTLINPYNVHPRKLHFK